MADVVGGAVVGVEYASAVDEVTELGAKRSELTNDEMFMRPFYREKMRASSRSGAK